MLSSVKGEIIQDAGLGDENFHVSGHFLMFFFLTFSYYRATKSIFLSIILSILYAVTDELHQRYTPDRSASLKDLYTDGLASLVAGGMIWSIYPRLPKTLKNLLEA